MADKSELEPRDPVLGARPVGPEGELVEAARHRVSLPLQPRELRGELLAGLTFLAAAIALLLAWPPEGGEPLMAAALVLAYALACHIRFEGGAGFAVPTQLALVPMLVLLPPSIVPLLVLAGIVLGELPEYISGKRHPQRALAALGSSWHAVGPALVLLAAGAPEPDLKHWPLYAAALLAQFALDLAARAGRDWYEYGIRPRGQLAGSAWIWAVAGLLSPIALVAAITVPEAELVLLILLPLLGLLALFAQERRGRLEQALELRNAYLGTTILLADLIEADDEHTGAHSHGVVALSVDVADELQLDGWQRRRTEYAARLHDVGKIAVPTEIVNKPGPLDPAEWQLMREHTVEAERMLSRVGGALREVGAIVRGTHERWDGAGYPDGLAGTDIPVEARIVACCDAFYAMTTDRSYRVALPTEAALNEIRRGSSTQFDPDVAAALIRVVLRREAEREAARPGGWPLRRRGVPAA
ncbi:MAG TPA: HD-GYP domain-containing protein [Thermoleophilaceae bacterium]|nr:HD-GYP domain-containing protein [Thermoleophilaceae bacterium]